MEQEKKSSFMDYLKAWGRFFISRYFIKNICIFIATVVVFLLLITQGLKWYTHHTEKISVPSVEGMTVAEAKKIIKERGLEAVVNDSTFECASKSIKPGQIIPGGQQPTAGYQVKKGRKIYLTYLAYTKQPATMPNINGESVETAKSLILGAGLIPGKITERENPHKGLVLEARFNGAKVSAGKQLHKGDIIDLIIGKGEDNDATTPFDGNTDTDIFNQDGDDSDDE
ncbi:MAG: PASTA domain-containing protein [Bacteroidales bacterium]|nr:PASTA domain-containing protein [Bacteroidales bacterium]MBO7567681.1 PASTA domain-containing protein [Bacteroidales bacterium]